MPLAGPVIARVGPQRTVAVAALIAGLALVTVGLGARDGVVPVVAGLVALGMGTGSWDVAMNVQGAAVERRVQRSMLPRFHAGFSLGTVSGAALGAAMVALGVSATVHLIAVGLLAAGVVPWSVRGFTAGRETAGPEQRAAPRAALTAWRDRRILTVGAFVTAFALAEGTGNDWISVATLDAHHPSPALATLTYASFLAAMTLTRLLGPRLLDRWGRVATVRGLGCLAIGGIAVFAFSGSTALAFLGAVLWGAGASLGFPTGMSAAADDAAHAAGRVSAVSSIGFLGFLGGPPLIGLIASQTSVIHALAAVIAFLLVALTLAPALRAVPVAGLDDGATG